jgi:hypothetical protein
MAEIDWDRDSQELEKDREALTQLEANTSLGKTLTYEASDAVDAMTRKLLLRTWLDLGGQPDPNKEQVEQLLERVHRLRRKVSRFGGARYEAEYRAWVQSWHQP